MWVSPTVFAARKSGGWLKVDEEDFVKPVRGCARRKCAERGGREMWRAGKRELERAR